MGASPGAALMLTRMNAEIDIRHVLPAVRVPTLVLHRTDDRCLKVEEGRYVASRVPGAVLVELPGEDHLPFVGDQDAMLDQVEDFLNRSYHDVDADRVLATVLWARVDARPDPDSGDTGFDTHARREIEWFRGRAVSIDGEMLTAAFDGPARAIRCATSIAASAARFGRTVRVGLHTAECDLHDGRLRGVAVDITRALAVLASPGEVLVSRTVKDLVAGSGQTFADRGIQTLGDDEHWRVFAVRGPDDSRQS